MNMIVSCERDSVYLATSNLLFYLSFSTSMFYRDVKRKIKIYIKRKYVILMYLF